MSIFARRVRRALGSNSPSRMRSEEVEVLLDRAVAVTGSRRPGSVSVPRCARISSRREVADVGLAPLAISCSRVLVELLEVVGGEVLEMLAPVEAEPARCPSLNGVDVLLLFPRWPGWCRRSGGCNLRRRTPGRVPIVQADGLGVSDVQVAVGLRREAGHDAGVLPGREIGVDDVADEVAGRRRFVFGQGG